MEENKNMIKKFDFEKARLEREERLKNHPPLTKYDLMRIIEKKDKQIKYLTNELKSLKRQIKTSNKPKQPVNKYNNKKNKSSLEVKSTILDDESTNSIEHSIKVIYYI